MDSRQLQSVDLNLLVVLDVLLQERSVSRAAARLHRTPSAVSHALGRLRTLLGDELLVRDGRRMSPTRRALELSDALPRALGQLASTLTPPEPFCPTSSQRVFRLVAPDFLAPPVLNRISTVAPGVRIEWSHPSPSSVHELIQGRCDALVASHAYHHEGLRAHVVGSFAWQVFGRSGHPAFSSWSETSWTASPHLQVGTSVLRGQGPIDQRLQALGLERRVAAVVPHFSMAAAVVAQTDYLLTLPSMTLHGAADAYGLERRALPFELPPMRLSMFRSATDGDEAGVQWLLSQIAWSCERLSER